MEDAFPICNIAQCSNPFPCYRTVNGVFNLEFSVGTSQGAAVLLQKYNFIGG